MRKPLSTRLSDAMPRSKAGAQSGLATARLARHSIMNDRPDPFGPPSGRRVLILCGSVVSRPSASMPQPVGTDLPESLALRIFPLDTVEVDMSMRNGRWVFAGTAIAIGLVETPAARAP